MARHTRPGAGLPDGYGRRMRAIQITEFGGPETLVVGDLPDPVAGDGQQVFDVLAAGINYADTHQTEDSYLAKQTLPFIPGGEVVVRDRRRAAAGRPARPAAVTPRRSPPIRGGCSRSRTGCRDAAALTTLVQGATAWHLLRTSTHLQAGESVVVHAGAGGVGTIADPAGQAVGRRAGHRHRVERGQAAAGPRPRRRRRRRLDRRRPDRRPARGQRRQAASTSCWR